MGSVKKLLFLLLLMTGSAWSQSWNINIGGLPIQSGSSLPASCSTNGSLFYKTSATTSWYWCNGGIYTAFVSGGGSVAFSAITSGTNSTATMLVGAGASLSSSGGSITATSAPWTGITGTPTTVSGYGITNAIITNPAAAQTITTPAAGGLQVQTIPCASLNATTTALGPCADNLDFYIVNSSGSASTSLRKGMTIYYEGDGQNTGTGLANGNSGVEVITSMLTGGGTLGKQVNGVFARTSITGTGTMASLQGLRSQWTVGSGATVSGDVAAVQLQTPNNAGTISGNVFGIVGQSLTNTGTITGRSVFIEQANASTYQYGMNLGGTIANVSAGRTPICFSSSTGAPTLTACSYSNTNTPEGAITANVGSIFHRENGGAGTSLYVKESGTGNTGWQTVLTAGGGVPFSSITGATNTTAAMVLGTGSSLTVSGSGTNNATTLNGATFAAPGTIGGTTPGVATFTTLTANGAFTTGANGGTQGSVTLNGSTSGSVLVNTDATATQLQLGAGKLLALQGSSSGTLTLSAGTTAATLSTGAAFSSAAITSSNTITAGAGNNFAFSGRSIISSASDGVIRISNNAASDFTRLQFGGTTSSFPALRRTTTALNVRLADDSADAALTTGNLTINAGTPILKALSSTATLDFGNLAAIGCEDLTITVTGAALGDTTDIGVPNGSVPTTTAQFSGWVSATNTVTIRYCDLVGGNPASGTFRATVWQF